MQYILIVWVIISLSYISVCIMAIQWILCVVVVRFFYESHSIYSLILLNNWYNIQQNIFNILSIIYITIGITDTSSTNSSKIELVRDLQFHMVVCIISSEYTKSVFVLNNLLALTNIYSNFFSKINQWLIVIVNNRWMRLKCWMIWLWYFSSLFSKQTRCLSLYSYCWTQNIEEDS